MMLFCLFLWCVSSCKLVPMGWEEAGSVWWDVSLPEEFNDPRQDRCKTPALRNPTPDPYVPEIHEKR